MEGNQSESRITLVAGPAEVPKLAYLAYHSSDVFALDLAAPFGGNIDRLKSADQICDHRLYDDSGCQNLIVQMYGANVLSVYPRINKDYGTARAGRTAFKQHYSRLTSSVVEMPFWAKPAASLFGRLKKWMQRGAAEDL